MVVNLLANLLRGEILMAKCRPRTDANQTRHLRYVQSHAAMKQEVTGDPESGVVPLGLLKKLKGCVKNGTLLIAQPFRANLRPLQPVLEALTFRGHANASLGVAFPAAEV